MAVEREDGDVVEGREGGEGAGRGGGRVAQAAVEDARRDHGVVFVGVVDLQGGAFVEGAVRPGEDAEELAGRRGGGGVVLGAGGGEPELEEVEGGAEGPGVADVDAAGGEEGEGGGRGADRDDGGADGGEEGGPEVAELELDDVGVGDGEEAGDLVAEVLGGVEEEGFHGGGEGGGGEEAEEVFDFGEAGFVGVFAEVVGVSEGEFGEVDAAVAEEGGGGEDAEVVGGEGEGFEGGRAGAGEVAGGLVVDTREGEAADVEVGEYHLEEFVGETFERGGGGRHGGRFVRAWLCCCKGLMYELSRGLLLQSGEDASYSYSAPRPPMAVTWFRQRSPLELQWP